MPKFLAWIKLKGSEEVAHILHLPFVERVLHPSSRRPLIVVGLSLIVMVISSSIAHHKEELSHLVYLPAVLIDAGAYLAHGMGAIPFVKYVEPVWAILAGAAEEASV